MKLATFLTHHAAVRGAALAVRAGARSLTFAELEETSARIAGALRARGVGVGDRVALLVPNGVEFVQAFTGIVKAGAVTVPVNTRLSADEVRFVLADSAPAAAFVDGRFRADLDFSTVRQVVETQPNATGGDTIAGLIAQGTGPPPDLPVEFDDCVISYTSGTTGRPKGAVLTQANYVVLNGFLNREMWGIGPVDLQLVTTPLAQRTGLARVMNMLCLGCGLVIPPRFDAATAAALIEAEGVTFMATVPTVARMLLPRMRAEPGRFASLRTLVATGEAFPLALKQQLRDVLPGLAIHSFYALTEVGLVASMSPDEQFTHPSSVGRIQPGVEARLCDEHLAEVPPGDVGELWVRTGEPGRFLSMSRYHDRPDATAETIRDGWVATGDLGRIDDEGYLHIVDRRKDMIVSGGFNIYSKEVEQAIAELPGVSDVAVLGVPDDLYGEAVVAYVEVHPGAVLEAETVIAHCRARIASYKKPRGVHFVTELPRNSTGKVLKRLLQPAVPAQ